MSTGGLMVTAVLLTNDSSCATLFQLAVHHYMVCIHILTCSIIMNCALSPSDCLKSIYVWAFTSGANNADSDDSANIEITAQGQTRSVSLPDLPEDDYTKNKGDLFKIPMS